MTSTASPGFSTVLAQVENTPPGAFFTAMRSVPSCTAEQIEYDRRTSSPPTTARSVRCWPCSKRYCARSASGTANVIATASRVSRSTLATCSGWNLLIGAAGAQCGLK